MQQALFVDGAWHPGSRGTFITVDPATGAPLADVAAAGPADVAAAVAAARTAVADGRWAFVPATRRGQVLHHLAQLILDRATEIARWQTFDTGTPVTVTRLFELPAAVEAIRNAASATLRFPGGRGRSPRVVGIVATPRFSFVSVVRAVVTALVDGDAVIVAASPHASLTTLLLAELTAEAGLPPGVLGVLTGPEDVARHLAVAPGVDRVVLASFAHTHKAVAIVTEDADVDELLSTQPLGGLAGVGRYATGYHHVDVHASRAEEFLVKLTAAVLETRLGPGRETATECGPLGTRADLDAVERYVAGVVGAGAAAVVGGTRPSGPLSQGWFYLPTVLVDGDVAVPIGSDAPVDAPVVRVSTWGDEDALRSRHPDGLWRERVALWSDDLVRANRLATSLQAGQVYVNAGPVVETDSLWQARGNVPRLRPQTREPGFTPRGPGSRSPVPAAPRTSPFLAPPPPGPPEPPDAPDPAAGPPAAVAPDPAATTPPPATDVPASWGGQVRRFAVRRFRVAQLCSVGASRGRAT